MGERRILLAPLLSFVKAPEGPVLCTNMLYHLVRLSSISLLSFVRMCVHFYVCVCVCVHEQSRHARATSSTSLLLHALHMDLITSTPHYHFHQHL